MVEQPTDETVATTVTSNSPFRRLLATRGFLALVVSNAFGFLGQEMRIAAQSWWILGEGGSNAQVGLAAGLRIIPVVIIGLYAGVMIDRFGGKRVLLVERWLLVVLALATALVLFSGSAEIWHIILLSTVAGATLAIGRPGEDSLIPEIVPGDLRTQANLMNQLGPSAGRTLGPVLAGVLIAIRNVATAFLGLTVIYVLAAVVTMRLPASRPIGIGADSAVHQIRQGFGYVRATPIIFWLMFLPSFGQIFLSMLFPVIPAIAVQVLDASEVQYAWMWGTMAIGQAVAVLLLAIFGGFKRQALSIQAAVVIFGGFAVLLGLTHTYWLALVFLFCMGLAFPLWIATIATLLQNFTAPEYRGRVMAIRAIALQSVAVAWMLGGWLIDVIGIFPTVLVAVTGGAGVLLIAMIASRELRSS